MEHSESEEIKCTSHKNENVRSYMLGFKLIVAKNAEEMSISAASKNISS